MKEKIGFIGAGTVATTFAIKMAEAGYAIVAVADIKPAMAKRMADRVKGCQIYDSNQSVVEVADLVIIATWDQAMVPIINQIQWRPNKGVVHTSGFFGTDILEPAKRAGARVGGLHPAQLFANVEQALQALPGSTFCLMGEPPLLDTLKQLVSAIKCKWIVLTTDQKPLYHVALAFAADFPMVCIKIATDLFQKFGISPGETLKILAPIIRGSVEGTLSIGFPHCFSGPITRGDLGVLSKHVATIEKYEPSLASLFKALDAHIVPMALAKGTIDEATAKKEREILS